MKVALTLLGIVLGTGTAHALPTLDERRLPQAIEILEAAPEADYSFNGAARLSGCSGSLFRYHGQSMDSPALVLTNGHCIGFLGAQQVLVNKPTSRWLRFYEDSQQLGQYYQAVKIVYATMHLTDTAILQLDATYQELADDGVDALLLAQTRGAPGEDIVVVSGYWEYTTSCRLDGFVHSMEEGVYTWIDSLRYTSECVTFGGTSGSPVIARDDGEIIGVNNTGYEGGAACSDNNPCEVDENGNVTTLPNGAYGQQTYWLYGCIDEEFALDLDREGCLLPQP